MFHKRISPLVVKMHYFSFVAKKQNQLQLQEAKRVKQKMIFFFFL